MNQKIILNQVERKWINSRGKGDTLDFTDEEIQKMRECFQSLDDDESGSIGIEELEGPLIGLGFYETRDECVAMIQSVD